MYSKLCNELLVNMGITGTLWNTIYGNAIPHSSSCKDLGINLSWRLHYQTITSKAYKSLGYYAVYLMILTVLWQEKIYSFQSLDLLCYTATLGSVGIYGTYVDSSQECVLIKFHFCDILHGVQ